MHSKRVPGDYEVPEDLARVVEAWPHLPEAVRAGIVVMVSATARPGPRETEKAGVRERKATG